MNISEEQKRIHEAYAVNTEVRAGLVRTKEGLKMMRSVPDEEYQLLGYDGFEDFIKTRYGEDMGEWMISLISSTI